MADPMPRASNDVWTGPIVRTILSLRWSIAFYCFPEVPVPKNF